MSRPPPDRPERLLVADATAFERRVLEAALRKQPSPEASARMAMALGVTAGAVAATAASAGTAAAAKKVAADATAAKATATAGATAAWPWVSIGVLGLVMAATVVGVRARRAPPPEPREISTLAAQPQSSPPTTGAISQPAAAAAAPTRSPAAPGRRGGDLAAGPADVREEIALLDAAREALSAGSDRRALELLRRYRDRFPSGSLRPEAAAIKIEALVKLGRVAEARALATRFVAEHRGSLLAGRVAALVGLTAPAAAP